MLDWGPQERVVLSANCGIEAQFYKENYRKMTILWSFSYNFFVKFHAKIVLELQNDHLRDQARGRLGRNSRPRGRNFALNGTQGEVGVSLKKKKIFFFLGDSSTQMQAVVTYYLCIIFLLPLTGNSMCNG